MNTKSHTFLLSLTFLFLFSGSVYCDDFQDGMDAANRGDNKEAVRLFRLSAEQGNATAQHNLGYMYEIGQGVPQDYEKAIKWYRIAAEQGVPQAQSSLGDMYANGLGVPQDNKEAFKWYHLSAEKGDAIAQHNLGNKYANGQGVPQDDKEAVRLFRLSAAQGNARAQHNLGFMYEKGRGVPQDYEKAFKWYRIAAEQGVPQAQSSLGDMYANGLGVPQDYVLAHMWFSLSGLQGHQEAIEGRNIAENKMTPQQIEKAQELARNWKSAPDQLEISEKPKITKQIKQLKETNKCPKCNLGRAFLEGADLSGADLSGADLRYANISYAILEGIILTGANLSNANLFKSNLSKANLENTNLTSSSLGRVNLKEANLTNANLSGTHLYSTILEEANLTNANLSGVDFRTSSWQELDLSKAIKCHTLMPNDSYEGDNDKEDNSGCEEENLKELRRNSLTQLKESKRCINCNLIGANLSGANLNEADLTEASLNGVDLTKANLTGADLTGANLNWANLNEANLNDAILKGAILERADLTGASLSGANLRVANLSRANLTGADLTKANLSRANLSRAKLNGAKLINVDLYGGQLHGAILERADLTGASLRGADLTGADLTNTILCRTIMPNGKEDNSGCKIDQTSSGINTEKSVEPLQDCSAWTSQKFAGEFVQKNLTIEKSPEKISEKMLYFKKLVENIPNTCLMDFTDSVQFENDKSTTPSLDQKCSVLGSLVALLNASKINYIRTIKTHDCLYGITFVPPPFEGRPESMEPFWVDNKWVWRNRSTGELLIFPDQKDCQYPQPFGLPCVGDKPPIPYAKGKVFPWKPWRPSQERKNSVPEDFQQRDKKNHAKMNAEESVIKEIRSLFSKWQPIIKKEKENEFKNSKTLYHYALNNYKDDEWLLAEIQSSEKVLIGTRIVIENEIGYFLNFEENARSGDSFLQGEHYYNIKGELYFVFWKLNTFRGLNPEYWDSEGSIIPSAESDASIPMNIPVTVETRLYFDHNGKIKRELESVYHMNTKEKTNRGYAFSDVSRDSQMEYLSYHFDELEFYELLKESAKTEEVVTNLKILAEQGDVESQSVLGYMYVTGTGVKQNLIEAQKWLKQAGEKGNSEAQYNLGLSYAEGDGQSKNYKESLKWYELAAKQGNPYALNNIGWMYEVGQGVSQDKEEALKWYRLASDKDDEVARRNISASFLNGKGKPRSYQEPIRHMHITAEYGDSKAMHKLGKMYALGEGVDQDYGAALKWFRLAAEEGNSSSQYNLGVMYSEGMGVEKDGQESLKWFRLSAKEGNEDAVERLMALGLWDSDSPNGNSKGDLSAKVEVLDRNPLEEKSVHEIPAARRSTYSAYADEPKGYPDINNSVKVNYKNIINGMAVEAVWEPIDTQGSSVLGEAIIKFTNVKNGESFTIYNSHFGLSKDSVKELNIEWDDERGRLKFDKKPISLKYAAPPPFKDDLGDAPFFFFDIDFDRKDELIVEGRHQGQRGVSIFKVYALNDGKLVDKQEQITDDVPYLELDGLSKIHINDKTINIHGSGGACNNFDMTYRFAPPKNGNKKGSYILEKYSLREMEDRSCNAYSYKVDLNRKLELIPKKTLGATPSPTINNKTLSPSKILQDKAYYDSLSQLAKEGDAEAQFKLGYMHDKGEGVSQDYKEAVKWYRLSAEQGNFEAKEKLSLLLAESREAREYFERGSAKKHLPLAESKDELDYSKSEFVQFHNSRESIKFHSNHFAKCAGKEVDTFEHKDIIIYSVKASLSCLISPLSKTKPRSKSKTGWKFDQDVTESALAALDSSSKDVLLIYESLFDGSDLGDGPTWALSEGLIRLSGSDKTIIATGPTSSGVGIQKVSNEYIIVREAGSFFASNYLISTTSMKAKYLSDGNIEVVDREKLIFKSYGRKSSFKEVGGAFWYNAIIDRNGNIIDIDNKDLDPKYKTCYSKSDFLKKSYIKLPESARDTICVSR